MGFTRSFFRRLLPTVLMAVGITFLTAGLLSYAPSTLGDPLPATPTAIADPRMEPTARPTAAPNPGTSVPRPTHTPIPSASPTSAIATLSPTSTIATPTASLEPSPGSAALATRIRISALGIDLPVVSGDLVVSGNDSFYPLCDVAMYLTDFVQPGQAGTAYLYAHAQRGMFLPLLRESENNDGAAMIGMLVEVYTADARLHLYEIDRVKRHSTDLSITDIPEGAHQLVLQTSEGPTGTIPKLQISARSLSVTPADPTTAVPSAAPRVCLPNR